MLNRQLRKYAMGAAGMLVLAMAILLAAGWGTAVAAQVTNVFVTNDASHAVPVQQQGTATVRAEGTPVTIELDQDGRYTVPAGKRLVIQYVNGAITLGTDPGVNPTAEAHLFVDGQPDPYRFRGEPVANREGTPPGFYDFEGDVTIYIDPSTPIVARFGPPASSSLGHIRISGILVSA